MIVPQYWAESRAQHKDKGRQITVRRFGWSDASLEEAQANADARCREALQRLLAGEKLPRRDPKVPYNGAAGVPIREEIVSRHGETIVTRNAYGARCLNTPDVLFADIDFDLIKSPPTWLYVAAASVLCALGFAGAAALHSKGVAVALIIAALMFSAPAAALLHRAALLALGGAERITRRRIAAHLGSHPQWSLRLYRTPAGMRLLATHGSFNSTDPAVEEFFKRVAVDPMFARMCRNQQCFRARVSAKPWRIGIEAHLRPRPGIWPINPARLPLRNAWIASYEKAAAAYAACSYVETLGTGVIHPAVRPVQELHDRLCSATGKLPIA